MRSVASSDEDVAGGSFFAPLNAAAMEAESPGSEIDPDLCEDNDDDCVSLSYSSSDDDLARLKPAPPATQPVTDASRAILAC